MGKNHLFFFLFFLSLFTVFITESLYAQEIPSDPQNEEAEAAEEEISPERQRMEMELKTSTLSELASWCRSLGLGENGTREELVQRIRQHFEFPERTDSAGSGQKIISINSAQTSEYFKIESINEEYARLRGDVSVSLKDGDHIHTIRAEEILFNRTRNILTARGGVVYTKTAETDGTVETFRGENITVNIDTWAAVFLKGDSEHTLTGEDTAYRFSGSVISRTDEDVTILKDAVITNAATEEPYWSITASRLWLLPGSDFAFVNAVLRVGEIPLLYLPAFYYASDDLIFHPVIGYRSREGGFIQSTTYILGRPKANEDDLVSITKILGSSAGMDTERQGIFLRSTGKKTNNPNEPGLRFLLDYYVNMGAFTALEFSLPARGFLIKPVDLSIGFGFTRTVSFKNGNWTPYIGTEGAFDWNHSNFFSIPVPFRYKIHFESGINMKYGTLSWNIPYYSDPLVNSDFYDRRAESTDWLNLMKPDYSSETTSPGYVMPYWSITGNFTPNVSLFSPYISRISISTFSMSLAFKNLINESVSYDSPVRNFFAPDLYTIYNFAASISGNPLSTGRQSQNASLNNRQVINQLEGIGEPVPPWEDNKETAEKTESTDIIAPPALNFNFALPGDGNLLFGINYSITPTSSSVLQFRSEYGNWKSAEEIDWGDVQSVITNIAGNADISFNLDHSSGLFSNKFTLSGKGSWRDFTYMNEDAEAYSVKDASGKPTGVPDPALISAARQLQWGHTGYSSSYLYEGVVRPFINDSLFSQSYFQYDLKGTFLSSKRYDKNNSPDGPELTLVWGEWAKETAKDNIYGLTAHQISTNLSIAAFNRQQTFHFRATLPPLDPVISANAAFRIWYSETSAGFGVRRAPYDAVNPGKWMYDLVTFTETVKYENISFVFQMAVNPEENFNITSIKLWLTLWDFRADFSAGKRAKKRFDISRGRWEEYDIDNKVLQPEFLSFAYNRAFPGAEFFNGKLRLSLSINTSLTFNLIEYTESSFYFTLGPLKLHIANFLELSLSAKSENSVIFRYFKNVPGMDHLAYMYPDGPQNNVFIDLIDSFNFADPSKRKRSGFKMNYFEFKLTHFLGDWEAEAVVDMYPYLRQGIPPRYEIATDFGFFVRWKPVTELKSSIEYKGNIDRWTSQ